MGNSNQDPRSSIFNGTSKYYHKYRKTLPITFIAKILKYCPPDTLSHLLDIGCATGRNTLLFANDFTKVTGIDINSEMIEKARGYKELSEVKNVAFEHAPAENYIPSSPVGLALFSSSFHWLRQDQVLQNLKEHSLLNLRIAITSCKSVWNKDDSWELAIKDILIKHLGKERRAGNGFYSPDTRLFDDILSQNGFEVIFYREYEIPTETTIKNYIGELLSTSHSNELVLGRKKDTILSEIEMFLHDRFPDGIIPSTEEYELIIAKLVEDD